MQRRWWPRALSLGFVLELGLRLAWVFDDLPEPVASHFDAAGRPNGYESKAGFATVALGIALLLLVMFSGLPALLPRLPSTYWNLPHKDYWLAPEQRKQTYAKLGALCDWIGCATLGFLCAVFELVIRANLQRQPLSWQIWLLIPGYVIAMLSTSLGLLRLFRRP